MTSASAGSAASHEHLSALADGELEEGEVGRACAAWHADPAQRATWHAYHLIGDVMRSDDLASDTSRDVVFLAALRERLAAEPVVLAPQALAPRAVTRRGQWSWVGTTAVAAGFVAVAGVLVVTRGTVAVPGGTSGMGAVLAAASAVSVAPAQVATAMPSAERPAVDSAIEPPLVIVDYKLIRDARLDQYLAAHKQFAGSTALGVPSAFLRSATADAAGR